MAVLMSYHKLVERDSKNVDYFWKYGTIAFLVLAVACCVVASLSLLNIIEVYDERCVLGADLLWLEGDETSPQFTFSSSSAQASSSSVNNSTLLNDGPEPVKSFKIDFQMSYWGKERNCDFAAYIPIFQLCFSVILATFFVICGKGGKAEKNSILPQPWRIVTPSLVFFLIMLIISSVNLSLINDGMKKFCESLLTHKPHEPFTCREALNYYPLKDPAELYVPPDINYILLISFSWTLFACWLILLLIKVARITLVIDFQLVRVTVRTCEFENTDERTGFQVVGSDETKDDSETVIKYIEFLHSRVSQVDNAA